MNLSSTKQQMSSLLLINYCIGLPDTHRGMGKLDSLSWNLKTCDFSKINDNYTNYFTLWTSCSTTNRIIPGTILCCIYIIFLNSIIFTISPKIPTVGGYKEIYLKFILRYYCITMIFHLLFFKNHIASASLYKLPNMHRHLEKF